MLLSVPMNYYEILRQTDLMCLEMLMMILDGLDMNV